MNKQANTARLMPDVANHAQPLLAGELDWVGMDHIDVPVRFEEDRLEISAETFAAGEIASVPLVEIRE